MPTQRESFDIRQNIPPVSNEERQNVGEFPEKMQTAPKFPDIKHELRQKETSSREQAQEQSMIDMIQEIRGKKTSDPEQESHTESQTDVDEVASEDIDTEYADIEPDTDEIEELADESEKRGYERGHHAGYYSGFCNGQLGEDKDENDE